MVRLCGLYSSANQPIPLEGTHVEARIVDMIAEVNVLQFYVNIEAVPIEAQYVFPLDSNAAVCDFQYEINGKIIQGQVKEKMQAKQEYNAAIRRGDGAALLEQEKADIFQISVGNIPPSTRVNVKITYVVELDNDEDFVKFLLPTTVAPRYIPPGHTSYHTTTTSSYKWIPYYRPWHRCWCDCFHWDRYYDRMVEVQRVHTHATHVAEASNTAIMQSVNANQQSDVPFALSLYLSIEMPSDIIEVVSSTHSIQTTKDSSRIASVMFVKDSEALDKDVVIKIRTASPHAPRAIIETCTGDLQTGTGHAVMLTLVPQFVLNDIQAEFIFIVDRSGSMSGSKMNQTRSALQLFLRALPANSYFNIIGFGSSHRSLFNSSQPYNEASVEKALQHAKVLQADLGGTELMAPLKAVYTQSPVPSYSRQVFVLTDGEVSNTEEVVRLVQENHRRNSNWRLFTIGVGSSVSHALVEGMARGGRGTCQIIGDGERLEPKVMAILKQALQPALTNLKVDWGATPPPPPSVSSGAPSATGFTTMAPKIGCLLGHRVNEQKPAISSAVRNDLVYQAPFLLPPVYSNKRFICYAYLHPSVNPAQITLSAISPDGPLDVTLPIERTVGNTIHRLAARALIRDLEEGSSHLHHDLIRPEESRVKKEIVDLGIKFNLSSKHTSFVAIEDRSDERSNWFFSAPPPMPQQRVVAHQAPAAPILASGYGGGGGYGGGVGVGYGGGYPAAPSGWPAPSGWSAPSGYPAPSASSNCYSAAPMSRSAYPTSSASSSSFSMAPPMQMQQMQMQQPQMQERCKKMSSLSDRRERRDGNGRGGSRNISSLSNADVLMDFDEAEEEKASDSLFGAYGAPAPSGPGFGYMTPLPAMPPQSSLPADSCFSPPAPLASSSLSATSSITRDPRSSLNTILDLQKLDGSFESTQALASILRLGLAEINAVPVDGVPTKAWATALVIAFLQQVLNSLKDEWELVADKSKGWINSELKKSGINTTNANQLVQIAEQTLVNAGIF